MTQRHVPYYGTEQKRLDADLCPSVHTFLAMIDTDPPRWAGMAVMDPWYIPEYSGPDMATYLNDTASSAFRTYVRELLLWDRDAKCWKPRFMDRLREVSGAVRQLQAEDKAREATDV